MTIATAECTCTEDFNPDCQIHQDQIVDNVWVIYAIASGLNGWFFVCDTCGEEDTNDGEGFSTAEFARACAKYHADAYHPHEVTR